MLGKGPRRLLAAVTFAACVVAGVLPPSLARAAEPDAKALSRARAKFQQAIELEKAGNCSAALQLLREVGELRMTPQVRYHIAFCEDKLGRLVAAFGGYELALEEADQVGASFKQEVTASIEDLKGRIPKLVIKRGAGSAAARVDLDGVTLGSTSFGVELRVDPGAHLVEATAPGQSKFTETVEIAERETKSVEIVLKSSSEPEPVAIAPTAPPAPPVDSGKRESPSLVLPIIIGGVGVASLAASGVFFLLKNDAISDLEAVCGPNRDECPKESESTYDNAKTYNVVSQVALGVGVVGVGVAVALLITQGGSEPAQETTRALRFEPSAPGSLAGASFTGRF